MIATGMSGLEQLRVFLAAWRIHAQFSTGAGTTRS
jgi:hypothetical protein